MDEYLMFTKDGSKKLPWALYHTFLLLFFAFPLQSSKAAAVAQSDSSCIQCSNSGSAGGLHEDGKAPPQLALLQKSSNIQRSSLSNIEDVTAESALNTATMHAATLNVGIAFTKMIKVGGEGFAEVLSQYAYSHSVLVLNHRNCYGRPNPLGQATCECKEHFIGDDALPPEPQGDSRFSMLYTHMLYDAALLDRYLVSPRINLVILRHPLHVLRSAYAHAAHQRVHERQISNSFCQPLADNLTRWLGQCPMVTEGRDSILHYLDRKANTELVALLNSSAYEAPAAAELDHRVWQLLNGAKTLLEESFVVGLQSKYDESMLLFERILGWHRSDLLFAKCVDRDAKESAHVFDSPEHAQAIAAWGFGTPRSNQIESDLERGPYRYYKSLYELGVQRHEELMEKYLGNVSQIQSEVQKYRFQMQRFSSCVCSESVQGGFSNPCRLNGTARAAEVRARCFEE